MWCKPLANASRRIHEAALTGRRYEQRAKICWFLKQTRSHRGTYGGDCVLRLYLRFYDFTYTTTWLHLRLDLRLYVRLYIVTATSSTILHRTSRLHAWHDDVIYDFAYNFVTSFTTVFTTIRLHLRLYVWLFDISYDIYLRLSVKLVQNR